MLARHQPPAPRPNHFGGPVWARALPRPARRTLSSRARTTAGRAGGAAALALLALLARPAALTGQAAPLADPLLRPAAAGLDVPALAARARLAVVRVRTRDSAGTVVGEATGLLLPGDLVLTDHSALRGAVRAEVVDADGRVAATVTRAAALSARDDLAVLRAAVPGARPLAWAATAPALGAPVVVVEAGDGGPDDTPLVAAGIVSARRRLARAAGDTTPPLLFVTPAPGTRFPGAPVLDAAGQVVGVGRMMAGRGPGAAYAAGVDEARAVVAAAGPDSLSFPSTGDLPVLASAAHKQFTFALHGCAAIEAGTLTCWLRVTDGRGGGRGRDLYVDRAHFAGRTGARIEAEEAELAGTRHRIRGFTQMALQKFAPGEVAPLAVHFRGVPADLAEGTLTITVSVGITGGEETLTFPDAPVVRQP